MVLSFSEDDDNFFYLNSLVLLKILKLHLVGYSLGKLAQTVDISLNENMVHEHSVHKEIFFDLNFL